MLEASGVAFEAIPAMVDERAVETGLVGEPPQEIARVLAVTKAMAVSANGEDRWVLGSDSLVVVAGRRFDKPRNRDEAADHLRFFSGRVMHLYSAAALVRHGSLGFDCVGTTALRVRQLSAAFIDAYLEHEWPAIAGCVGVFRIEGRGAQLFDAIEGDHFTVLGMPLLQVLPALRQIGELLS